MKQSLNIIIIVSIMLLIAQPALCLRPASSIGNVKAMEAEEEKIVKKLADSDNIAEIRAMLGHMRTETRARLVDKAIERLAKMQSSMYLREQVYDTAFKGMDIFLAPSCSFVSISDRLRQAGCMLIKEYDILLRALFLSGFLEGDIIALFAGIDFLPAKYGRLIQVDNEKWIRQIKQQRLIRNVARLLGVDAEQLNYRVVSDAITMNAAKTAELARRLPLSRQQRTVILKGSWYLDVPGSTMRFFQRRAADGEVTDFFQSEMAKAFFAGLDKNVIRSDDFVILLGPDVRAKNHFLETGHYKEIPISENLKRSLPIMICTVVTHLWFSPVDTMLIIPSDMVILQKQFTGKLFLSTADPAVHIAKSA